MRQTFPVVLMLATLAGCASLPSKESTMTPQFVYKTVGDRQLVMDADYPEGWRPRDKRPAIVFFCGGAWRTGATKQFTDQAKVFAAHGMVALRAEYRDTMRDKVTVDVCVEDAISAMRFVRTNARRLGVDPDRIVAAGGSAGGFLAASTWTTQGIHAEGEGLSVSPQPNAMVLFNPVFDLLPFREKHGIGLGISEERAKQVSPNWNVRAGIPPTLIMVGTEDEYLGQMETFRDRATAMGAQVEMRIYEGQRHAFFNQAPWKEKTVADGIAFLRDVGVLR